MGALTRSLGSAVEHARPVRGGDVAMAYAVDLADGRRVFAKTHPGAPAPFFTTEAAGLQWLRAGVDPERVERVVNGIVRRLESSGESEIPSTQIGELVMDALRALDPVAYVRFASVYRNFREARDFEEFISDLAETNLKD